jgi:sugar O-acyltransferase (sialic acid O-acetyltransferase NeuD family)
MIIIGAKGLAKEVLDIFAQRNELENLFFFDDISHDLPEKLYDRFQILRSVEAVEELFRRTNDYTFTLGLGNPLLRHNLAQRFIHLGGAHTSAISSNVSIGMLGNNIANGCTVLSGAVITSGVTINEGCLINPHCSISHDTVIGKFVEMSPGVRITGHVRIGDFSNLGTNSTILPHIEIGSNVIVGAGAVVTHDVDDNTLVVGVPASVKRKLTPLEFES